MSKVNAGQAPSTLIPEYIGSDFDAVLLCADNMTDLKGIADNFVNAGVVADNIDNVNAVALHIDDVDVVANNIEYVKDVSEGIAGLPVISYIGATPPLQPAAGSEWYCTTDGRTYVYYVDAASTQWVESSPQSTIGVSDTFALWKRSLAEIGLTLVGTFQEGCTVTAAGQAVLDLNTSLVYQWEGVIPPDGKAIPVGSTPATAGDVSPTAWVDRTSGALRNELASPSGLSLVGFAPSLPGAETVNASRFLPQTSPISYGAFFNGVDDDTAGINKAIKAKGPNSYCIIQFPAGATAKILGTILIPSGVKIDLNGCTVNGSGSNVMFEGGKWSGSSIVSSFNDAPEASLTVDAWIGNGLIQECMTAVKINNWVAGCRVHNLRGYHVNQMLHEKRSFYCEFHNLMAWEPLDGTLLPCFHWETAIQAQGVKRCFAVGYTKGHTIQGPNDMESFDTCGAEDCVDGVYITGTASLGGGGSGLTFRNWYFENNGTAIKADPAYNYENIDIDNCFFNANFVTLDGPTILSGRFGRMNKVKTTAGKPGNINMLSNLAGKNGFTIMLEEVSDSTNRTDKTIDTTGRFFVGPNVRIERVVTLTDGSGVPYARNVEAPNIPVERITGSQFGSIPNNTVPFCETYYTEPALNVKTQMPYQDFAMFSYNINVVDTTGSYWVRGVVMGDQVFPLSAGQKTVAVVNGGGFSQLNISVFTGAATYRGVVKHL